MRALCHAVVLRFWHAWSGDVHAELLQELATSRNGHAFHLLHSDRCSDDCRSRTSDLPGAKRLDLVPLLVPNVPLRRLRC